MQKYSVSSSSNLDRDGTRQDAVPANALIAEKDIQNTVFLEQQELE